MRFSSGMSTIFPYIRFGMIERHTHTDSMYYSGKTLSRHSTFLQAKLYKHNKDRILKIRCGTMKIIIDFRVSRVR